jgi:hypothetical protein
MTPAAWYDSRISHWTATRDTASRAVVFLSRLRLATFLSGVALLWWGLSSTIEAIGRFAPIAGVALLVAFGVLVIRHARQYDIVERADAALKLNAEGHARLSREWNALPEVAAPPDLNLDAHPYARDLDLYGHASLSKWLGRPATIEGTRYLNAWLLEAADPAVILDRQRAIDDLAARREWRERLALEGLLTNASPTELARFLEWAEGRDFVVPRLLQVVAIVLPLLTIGLLTAFLADWTDGAWFLIPLTVAIVLSFFYAPRMYAVFDRATVGQRALERYGEMLGQACREPWTADALQRLKGALCAGGDAPTRVIRLARLGGWSELRTGAALLHTPVQALTLWDFHIYFAFERWRAQSGSHVRGWLDALGAIDALAVLSRVRADEPSWTMPRVDPQAASLQASAVGHPLIAPGKRVDNDVAVGPKGTLVLITGSNMSGKSTLLRAIGLNIVLAQTGAPVCATKFTMPPCAVQTSIRVQDSLELGLSYFMAALARLKQIVDSAQRGSGPGRVLFYLLDEVLQGTNSIERGLAVRAVVRHLLDAGAIGVMTTHDLALADEEPIRSAAHLAHFTEHVHADGTMTFDYRLRPGLATSTNALRLMQLIGISSTIPPER